ncbi:STAS-like domain-containing protein [Roseibium sp.]|uniref:STAS-like domain-containing protein n=1 Tax=Roseibium sp. TaxID=1936156 RepID=UPI003266DD5F
MADITIRITEITGSGVCVTSALGAEVYNKIYANIKKGNRIALSFSGITRMTTAFLNSAVGQLYGEFTEAEIKSFMLPPRDTEAWHLSRLKMVNDRAKQYFSDRKRYGEVVERTLGDV